MRWSCGMARLRDHRKRLPSRIQGMENLLAFAFLSFFLACGTWVGWGIGVQKGCGGCGELARRGGGGDGGARGPSLYVQVGFEAIYSWRQHAVLT